MHRTQSISTNYDFTTNICYRDGFNGMEKDDEVKGSTGSSYDFGARIYDSRLGRWLATDPLTQDYPFGEKPSSVGFSVESSLTGKIEKIFFDVDDYYYYEKINPLKLYVFK